MEDAQARQQRIVREEMEAFLAEMERRGAGDAPALVRPLVRGLWWCVGVVGAVLAGLLCGILSHVAVLLLARALG